MSINDRIKTCWECDYIYATPKFIKGKNPTLQLAVCPRCETSEYVEIPDNEVTADILRLAIEQRDNRRE